MVQLLMNYPMKGQMKANRKRLRAAMTLSAVFQQDETMEDKVNLLCAFVPR